MSTALNLDIDDLDVITPEMYARSGHPHEAYTRLRHESPVHYFANGFGGKMPFWAITKHEHITAIGRTPDLFLSNPQLVVTARYNEPEEGAFKPPDTLIQQDNPMHRKSRKLISSLFTPKALRKIHADVERIGKKIVDDLLAEGEEGEVDFVDKVSAPLPIAVIAWLLGVPESDWRLLYDWTNRSIGAEDPEFADPDGDSRAATLELFTYFSKLVEEKKKNPADDLITLFAHAEIDGKKLDPLDVLAWCQIIVVAGNETTRNGTSGGILALAEHPESLQRIQRDPTLLKSGIEEILRWSTPIIHFARTVAEDTDFYGHSFKKGDLLALFYGSANRDEDIFEEPFTFQIDRKPNRHIAFGVGEHYCAGAHVARLEMDVAYRHLLPRLEKLEIAGPVDRLQSNLIAGIKRLPIRYKLKPA